MFARVSLRFTSWKTFVARREFSKIRIETTSAATTKSERSVNFSASQIILLTVRTKLLVETKLVARDEAKYGENTTVEISRWKEGKNIKF